MAKELIGAQGANNADQTQGNLNFLILNNQGGGPVQDVYDAQTAGIAEAFLGMAHVNCLLCHNGRGHLDTLSLWAGQTTRYQAWQLSSFISHTGMPGAASPIDPNNPKAGRLTTWAFTTGSTDRELQEAPYEMIVGAQGAAGGQFGPIVDGAVVPRDPFDPDAPAISADVPLMAGSNLHDSRVNPTAFN